MILLTFSVKQVFNRLTSKRFLPSSSGKKVFTQCTSRREGRQATTSRCFCCAPRFWWPQEQHTRVFRKP